MRVVIARVAFLIVALASGCEGDIGKTANSPAPVGDTAGSGGGAGGAGAAGTGGAPSGCTGSACNPNPSMQAGRGGGNAGMGGGRNDEPSCQVSSETCDGRDNDCDDAVDEVEGGCARLGDLTIGEDRVPHWHHLDHLPIDTSDWTVVDVPCGSASAVINAVEAAQPRTVLQLAQDCTYLFSASGNTFELEKSFVVIRGAPDLSSVFEFQHNDQTAMMLGTYASVFGNERAWTDGYGLNESILTLAHTNGLSVGDWVRLRANNEPDWHANARNGYVAKLACVGNEGDDPDCASLSADQVKLDRPLNSEFHQGGQVLEVATGNYVEFSGLERVRIQHQTPDQIEQYRPRLQIQGCYECWVTDCSFGDAGNAHISLSDSARVLMRGNDFGSNQCTDDGVTCDWNKGAVYYNDHTYDTVFENNVIIGSPSGPLLQHGGGNVVAYNYIYADPQVACERHVFLHGQGVRSSLVEGNDVSCMMQWDSYRAGQGYYNTFYRNRLRGSPQQGMSFGGYYRGRLGGERQGSFIHRNITVIANHVNELMGGPQPNGVAIDFNQGDDEYHLDTWVGYNVARTGALFDPNGVGTTDHENVVGDAPPSSWADLHFPISLYRRTPPSWWCEESGPFPNIGAPSDTEGNYSTLPAEIRASGGTCTPPTN